MREREKKIKEVWEPENLIPIMKGYKPSVTRDHFFIPTIIPATCMIGYTLINGIGCGKIVHPLIHTEILCWILIWLLAWLFQYLFHATQMWRGRLFHILRIWLLFGLIGFFSTRRTLRFYILFEMALIPTLGMIFFFGYQPEKIQACKYLITYTVSGSLPLLVYILSQSKRIRVFFQLGGEKWVPLILTLAFMVKTPLYLLHIWLPKAHLEAPLVGSIILAGVLLKMGSYGFILFSLTLQPSNVTLCYLMLRATGRITCGLICCRQGDSKRLVAYSSVVHMGVVTIGVVSGSKVGMEASILIIIAHGFCRPMIFSVCFLLYKGSHSRLFIRNKKGLRRGTLSFLLFLLVCRNLGVPPTLGLWSEMFLLLSLYPWWSLGVCVFILSLITRIIYNIFFYTLTSQGKRETKKGEERPIFNLGFLNSITLLIIGWGSLSTFSL